MWCSRFYWCNSDHCCPISHAKLKICTSICIIYVLWIGFAHSSVWFKSFLSALCEIWVCLAIVIKVLVTISHLAYKLHWYVTDHTELCCSFLCFLSLPISHADNVIKKERKNIMVNLPERSDRLSIKIKVLTDCCSVSSLSVLSTATNSPRR